MSQANQHANSNQPVLPTLINNFTKYLDQCGIHYDEAKPYLEDLSTLAMFIRMRITPIINSESALAELIPIEVFNTLTQEQRTKCHRFLCAISEVCA